MDFFSMEKRKLTFFGGTTKKFGFAFQKTNFKKRENSDDFFSQN